MSIKARLTALEAAHAEVLEAEAAPTPAEIARDERHGVVHLALRGYENQLAEFIGEPVRGHIHKNHDAAPMYALIEVWRCGVTCGQSWLRMKAQQIEMQLEDFGPWAALPFTVEDMQRERERYLDRADELDAAGIPDMSTRRGRVPLVAGETWLSRLAWAMALGNQLDAELEKVQSHDALIGEFERYQRNFSGIAYYVSPIGDVPPVPDWLTAGLEPNPFPCEPFLDNALLKGEDEKWIKTDVWRACR